MRHYITMMHPEAPGSWALCADGAIVKKYGGRDVYAKAAAMRDLVDADSERWALIAAATPEDDANMVPWTSAPAIGFVGVPTDDRRVIDEGAVTFRNFPMPVLAQTVTQWGHEGAFIVGRMDDGAVSGKNITASGVIDCALDGAEDVARMVKFQTMDRVSIDPAGGEMECEVIEVDEDGWITDWLDHYTSLKIGGVTICSISAFADARISITADPPSEVEEGDVIAASAAKPAKRVSVDPDDPPLEYFDDPRLPGRTRLTISEPNKDRHRRVFGHLAPWGECHIGLLDECVVAPRSPSNYGWFQLGTMRCAEGCEIPIGTLVMADGHADKSWSARAAAGYYDNPEWVVADVTVGEDEHGIWYSGAVRRDLSTDKLRAMRAARLSGDWRSVNGQLDLIAAAFVNTGGFPVYEKSLAADGSVRTLIAATGDSADGESFEMVSALGTIHWQDEALRKALNPLLSQAADALSERVHAQ